MVTITNGVRTFSVTSGSVNLYKSMGFSVVSDEILEDMKYADKEQYEYTVESDKTKDNNLEHTKSDVNEEDAFIEELLEKPLSQWKNEEVKDFVRIKGIDTSGAQKVSQVRDIIKTYLEEQNKNM